MNKSSLRIPYPSRCTITSLNSRLKEQDGKKKELIATNLKPKILKNPPSSSEEKKMALTTFKIKKIAPIKVYSESAIHDNVRNQTQLTQEEIKNPTEIIGLENIGNSCFMNSALQCLIHTEELSNFILSGKFEENTLAKTYKTILEEVWQKNNKNLGLKLLELKSIVGNNLNEKVYKA